MARNQTWKDGKLIEDIEVPDPPLEDREFNTVIAADFKVKSPKVKDNPKEALAEAVDEGNKESKSIALIALSLAKAVEDIQKRLEALEKKV